MTLETSAPSNIALIKYMGKSDFQNNRPTNSSLSWTLEDLRTFVRISLREDLSQDEWTPLERDGLAPLQLSEKSRSRFLSHFQMLKSEFQIKESFLVESANNFPADCGLASSASSFAALTIGALQVFEKINAKVSDLSVIERARLSQKGSGSSCRSFFGPWALWFSEGVRPVEFSMEPLLHQVIIVTGDKKEVGSSEAHRRVLSSDLFRDRPQRADVRLAQLMEALKHQDWSQAFAITWSEFWDMHALFETSKPPFGYMLPDSLRVLRFFDHLWKSENDGPLVTMDAGANVHLLYRADQKDLARKIKNEFQKDLVVFQCKELL